MSRESFEEAEKVLNFHDATLPSFLVANGTHSRYYEKNEKGELINISKYNLSLITDTS